MLALVFLLNSVFANENLIRIDCFDAKTKISLTQSDTGATMSVLTPPDKLSSFSIEAKGIGMAKDAVLAQVIRLDLDIVTAVGVILGQDDGVAKKNFEMVSLPQSFQRNRRTKELTFRAQISGDLVPPPNPSGAKISIVTCTTHYESEPNLNP